MKTTRLVRGVVFAVIMVLAMMAFAGVVFAGGPVLRLWAETDCQVHWSSSTSMPVKGETLKMGEEALWTTIAGDWVQLAGSGFWVRTECLTQEEPEKSVYEVLAAKKMSEITAGEYYSLTQWYAGTTLAAPATTSAATTTYVVKAGDSLSAIGKALGVDWRDLAKANSIVSPYTIEIGQQLTIPASGAAAPVALASAAVSGWPATAEQFLALASAGQPVSDGTWRPIEIGEIHRPVGEANAWAVTREKNKEGVIIPFFVRNFSGRAQDGYCLLSGKYTTGTPANFAGLSQGVTFRP